MIDIKRENTLLWFLLFLAFILALSQSNFELHLNEMIGNFDGRFSLTCDGDYCTAKITRFWDNKAVGYYWRHTETGRIVSYMSWEDKSLPFINPEEYEVYDNQLYLKWGSCSKKVWNIKFLRVGGKGWDRNNAFQYGIEYSVGGLNENSGCLTDIQANVGSTISGYIVFVKKPKCPETLVFDPSRPYEIKDGCIYQKCEEDESVVYSYCLGRPTNDLILTQEQIEEYLYECKVDADCDSTEICEDGKCVTLECEKGYKAENHKCVVGIECENDEDCYWCGNTCQSTLFKDKLFCPMVEPPENLLCQCVSNKCTEVEKPKICNEGETRNEICISNTTLQYDLCKIYYWETQTYDCPQPTLVVEHGEAIGYCDESVNECRVKIHCDDGYRYNEKTGKCESVMFPLYILGVVIIIIVIFGGIYLLRR